MSNEKGLSKTHAQENCSVFQDSAPAQKLLVLMIAAPDSASELVHQLPHYPYLISS